MDILYEAVSQRQKINWNFKKVLSLSKILAKERMCYCLFFCFSAIVCQTILIHLQRCTLRWFRIFDLSSNTVELKKWLGLSKQTVHLLFYNRTVDSSKLGMFAKNDIIAGTLEMSSALWATWNVTCSIKQQLYVWPGPFSLLFFFF